VAQERSLREALVDFLLGVLDLDPSTRWTPRQALQHPFITGGIFQVLVFLSRRAQPRSSTMHEARCGVD